MSKSKNKSTKKVAKKAKTANSVVSKIKSGDAITIAAKTGFSRTHVINVLAGRRNNSTILSAATKLTSRRK